MTEGAKTGEIHYLPTLVHDTFNSPLGDSGDYEGHSVIRTQSGGVWYADSIDPDDEHCEDHAEIVRRVNEYPALRQSLTEALKVAGEALAFIECEARTDDACGYHGRAKLTFEWVSQRRAALERIRNKGQKTPTGEENE